MSKTYPEHNKVLAIKNRLDIINGFLDWLTEAYLDAD